MPKQIVEDQLWKTRISSANRYHDSWESLFKCKVLEKYYEGFQWKSQRQLDFSPYVINKVYETIQIKIATFVPTFLKYLVTARPANSQLNLEGAAASSQLKEDVLNTIIWDNKLNFHEEVELAYKDSFFRFGLLEVDYAANWIINPNAPKPTLNKDVNRDQNRSGKRFIPPQLPVNERVYFKHIGARRFRVGGLDNKYLSRCGWFGYYEWVDRDELLSMPKLMNRDKIEGSVPYTVDRDWQADGETSDFDPDNKRKYNAIKIWHIWDNVTKMRLIVLDAPVATIWQKKFTRIPLFDLRPDRRLLTEGFYPIPPVFHWLSPQDEINEIRDQLRNHRRRFIRKFQYRTGSVDDEEVEKFETGPDGGLIRTNNENAIVPIDNADLGNAIAEATQTSGDDLNQISGTSAEVRGVADRTTATQANIISQQSSLRGNKERDRLVDWLSGIGREVLLITRDRFTIGTWAKLTTDPGEDFLGTIKENSAAYQWVTTEDLNDGYDFAIDVDVTSLSVAAQQDEKQKFIEFLTLTTQFPQIALSPKLIREAAYRVGYRNETMIREMQKMALFQQAGRMNQLMQQAGANGQQMAQGVNQQQTPSNIEQTRNQIQNQLGVSQ